MTTDAARLLSASSSVPEPFRGNVSDCAIAVEIAKQLGAEPLDIMRWIENIPPWAQAGLSKRSLEKKIEAACSRWGTLWR